MSKTPHRTWVNVGADSVQLTDHLGVIKTWRLADWAKDPQLVLAIAEAIQLAGLGIDVRGLVDTGRLSLDRFEQPLSTAREAPKVK